VEAREFRRQGEGAEFQSECGDMDGLHVSPPNLILSFEPGYRCAQVVPKLKKIPAWR
jgi:hypothetical protein